jgi:hypothetical protein
LHPDYLLHVLRREQAGDTVKVKYSGKLDNGKVFDSGDISFPLGAGHVIKGWDIVRLPLTILMILVLLERNHVFDVFPELVFSPLRRVSTA